MVCSPVGGAGDPLRSFRRTRLGTERAHFHQFLAETAPCRRAEGHALDVRPAPWPPERLYPGGTKPPSAQLGGLDGQECREVHLRTSIRSRQVLPKIDNPSPR